MKIEFERSGGLTGQYITATIDTQCLDAVEVRRLQELIASAAFFELPSHLPDAAPAIPDQFYYKVSIVDEGQSHSIETTDGAAAAELRPLLHHLTRLARRF